MGSRAARVNSSDIRNTFWCDITVLAIVLSLFITFKQSAEQCTLLMQHKQHKTNASGFGLRTSFHLGCKRTKPLNAKVYEKNNRKKKLFSEKSTRSACQSLYTLAFVYKPQNTGVFSCSILNRNRKREPIRKTPTGHHGFDCRSYRGRSCRMQG